MSNEVITPKDLQSNVEQIVVPNYDEKRRNALAEIDNAKFGWFHVRTCIVAGVGFFTDAYDLFAINLVSAMMGYVYFSNDGNTVPSNIDLGLKTAATAGAMAGQVLFGVIADIIGRKKIYGVELMIIIVTTLASALSGSGPAVSVQGAIIFWRIILGFGIGGDYPLSAVITSEFANVSQRGAMIAAVFAMQGFGILTSAVVGIIALSGFKSAIESNPEYYIDYVWRIVLGMGAVPGVVALYFRLTIPETPRYTMDIERNVDQASQDIMSVLQTGTYKNRDAEAIVIKVEAPKASWSDFFKYVSEWKNGKILLGTSLCWFSLDVAFYGLGLNNSFILKNINLGTSGQSPYNSLYNVCVGNIIITLLGTIPGYWFAVFTVDKIGRIPVQKGGFLILTALFLILGLAYYKIQDASTALFIFLFTLTQLFTNFGPNTTTFIIPGEVFPTRYRSTCHGISAASGKLGAIVAQVGFSQLVNRGGKNKGIPLVLDIFAIFMFVGLIFTFLIPETKKKSLESLSNENQEGFVKGLGSSGQARVGLFAYRANAQQDS